MPLLDEFVLFSDIVPVLDEQQSFRRLTRVHHSELGPMKNRAGVDGPAAVFGVRVALDQVTRSKWPAKMRAADSPARLPPSTTACFSLVFIANPPK